MYIIFIKYKSFLFPRTMLKNLPNDTNGINDYGLSIKRLTSIVFIVNQNKLFKILMIYNHFPYQMALFTVQALYSVVNPNHNIYFGQIK